MRRFDSYQTHFSFTQYLSGLNPDTAARHQIQDTGLDATLSIKSILLCGGAEGFADGYGDALAGAGFHPGGCNALKARVTK